MPVNNSEQSLSKGEILFRLSLILLFVLLIFEIRLYQVDILGGRFGHVFTSKELVFLLYILVSLLFSQGMLSKVLKEYKYMWAALAAFLAVFGVSALTSSDAGYSAQAWLKYLAQGMVFFGLLLQLKSARRIEFLAGLLFGLAAATSLFGIIETIWPEPFTNLFHIFKQDVDLNWQPRISSIFLFPHFAAGYIVVGLITGTLLYLNKKMDKRLYYAATPVCLFVLGSTGARGAWIALLAALAAGYLLAKSTAGKRMFLALAPAFLLLNFNNVVFMHTLNLKNPVLSQAHFWIEADKKLEVQDTIKSAQVRIMLLHAAVAMFKEHRLVGVGPGMFKQLFHGYLGQEMPANQYNLLTAHNLFMNLMAEGGILTLAALVLLAMSLAPLLARPLPNLTELLPFFAVLVTQLFDAELEAGEMALLFWSSLALALATRQSGAGNG